MGSVRDPIKGEWVDTQRELHKLRHKLGAANADCDLFRVQ